MQTIKLNWKENVWKSNNEFRFGILVTIDVFTNFICEKMSEPNCCQIWALGTKHHVG